jgi:CHASE3 domain sensor protein
MKTKKYQQLLIASIFLLPVVILISVAFLLLSSHRELIQSSRSVILSKEIQDRTQNLLTNLLNAEASQRDYLLTSSQDSLLPYQKSYDIIHQELESLLGLTKDNSLQLELFSRLHAQMNKRITLLNQTIRLKQEYNDKAALSVMLTNDSKQNMNEIRHLTASLSNYGIALLHEGQHKMESETGFIYHLAFSLMLLDAIALAAIAYMLKRLQSLNRIVTVCAWSKTIKSDGGWISFEAYLQEQFGISVSHGISKVVYDKLMNEPENVLKK